jgi:hypothetical protein
MAVAPDTVRVSSKPGADGGSIVVEAAFKMRPTGAEVKEAVVGIVGVSEVRGVAGSRGAFSPPTPGLWSWRPAQAFGGGGEAVRPRLRRSCLGMGASSPVFPTRPLTLLQVGGGHFLADPLPGEAAKPAVDPAAVAKEGSIAVNVSYTVSPDGSVLADWRIDASESLPAPLPWGFKSLPRVGIHLALAVLGPDAASTPVAWYGAGPHECYPDRKDGAPVRVHTAPGGVAGLHVPYVFPGECGGRADVRWLALGGRVVAASLGGPVQANVSRFPLAVFSGAGHDEELVADGSVHVHLDAAHMGVGGDDSWSPAVWEVSEKRETWERVVGRWCGEKHGDAPSPPCVSPPHTHHTHTRISQDYAVPPKPYELSILLAPVPEGGDATAVAEARWLARG